MFIVFEGIDGSGKSTNLKLLASWLKRKKIDFFKMREPGGSCNSEKIRKLFIQLKLDPLSQLFLISAARKENMKIIKENNDKLIICDRFIDSTYAYQGLYLDNKIIDKVVELSVDCYPDYVFLFLNQYAKKNINQFDLLAKEKAHQMLNIYKNRVKDNYILIEDGSIKEQQEFIRNKIIQLINK